MAALVAAGIAMSAPEPAFAQWSTVYEQYYLPGSFNWQFRHNYASADRLFNGFDFGHAILYETLWTKPGAPVAELEEKWYNRLTREILVHPPRVPLEEGAIEIAYAKLAPEAKVMFDWAHLFHRQVYDVWADERLSPSEKDAKVAELTRYYKSRPDLAFSSQPKTMELMEGQPYSLAFRKNYPKFNGLIWAYHWLQVGLYEPLVVGRDKAERLTGVNAAVSRFWQMLEDPPTNMPRIMPMTAAVAPQFAARYPEAAIIFDNLHSMHDVVSDILANPDVPRDRKRDEILVAARRFRDDTSFVMTVAEWRDMAQMMGIENMGGPAVGFLAEFPQPTVERGAVMAGMDHSQMPGMRMRADSARPGAMDHARMHGAPQDTARGAVDHAAMGHMTDSARAGHDPSMMARMMDMHVRMMADTGMRRHMLADTAMRRMMVEMLPMMSPEHREQMEQALRDTARAGTPAPRRNAPARQPAAKPATPPADPHAGHGPPPKPPTTTRPPATRTPPPASPTDPHAGHTTTPPPGRP
jgi:hypothetical protein